MFLIKIQQIGMAVALYSCGQDVHALNLSCNTDCTDGFCDFLQIL